jgi:hypothetical protein
MKKVIAGVFVSLDGVVENPQDWHFPYFNDEIGGRRRRHPRPRRHGALRSRHVRQLRRRVARA